MNSFNLQCNFHLSLSNNKLKKHAIQDTLSLNPFILISLLLNQFFFYPDLVSYLLFWSKK